MKKCPQCQMTYPDSASFCPRDASALAAADSLEPGMTIRRKYRIVSEIGRGGMGVVYRAQHLLFQEERALKVVSGAFASDPKFASRFLAEVLITRQLHHPNIVRVEDADETEDGQPFAVMEYVAGESLRHIIRREGVLEPARAFSIAAQVCAALAAAHQRGIIHRDIKPDNILLVPAPGGGDMVKVLDFGIAKVKEEAAITLPEITSTKTGFFVGTPEYASPEQALGKKGSELDERTDLYSLGVVLYEMLSGQLPFRADTPMGMLLHQIQTPPERPCLALPESVLAVLLRSLAKDRGQRYSSAEEMRLALEQAARELRHLRGVPTPAESPAAGTRLQFVPTPPSAQAKAASASAGAPAHTPASLQPVKPSPKPGPAPAWAEPAGEPRSQQPPTAFQPQQQPPRPGAVWTSIPVLAGTALFCVVAILVGVFVLRQRSSNQAPPAKSEPAPSVKSVETAPPADGAPATSNAAPGTASQAPQAPSAIGAPAAGAPAISPRQPAAETGLARQKPDTSAGEAATSKPAAVPAQAAANAAEPAYLLQLMEGSRKEAESVLRTVKAAGFQARIEQEPADPLARVLVGPFSSRAQADDMRMRLELQGFKPKYRR